MVTFVNGNGLRPGYVIKVKGDLYRVMTAEHRTPGKGKASMQAKLRKLKDGTQTEIKFRSDENVERAEMEQVDMEYLYEDPSGYCYPILVSLSSFVRMRPSGYLFLKWLN